MFIDIDLMTKESTALSVGSLNFAVSNCSVKYWKHHLRVYASDITLKDENVTDINKKADTLFAPSEEVGLFSRMWDNAITYR
jgi:hypothetical protein